MAGRKPAEDSVEAIERELRGEVWFAVGMAVLSLILIDSWPRYIMPVFVVLMVVGLKLVDLMLDRQHAARADELQQLRALDSATARQRCEQLFVAPETSADWLVTWAAAPLNRAELDLGPETRAFFDAYRSVRQQPWGIVLDRDLLAPSAADPDAMVIGTTSPDDESDISGPMEYRVQPGSDLVTGVWDDPEFEQEQLPSVWHAILDAV
jgi:hypothetical protein